MTLELLPRTRWRKTKDAVHDIQARLGKWWGRPDAGMRTDLTAQGHPVIFVHNPKSGGTSLGRFLHVKRRSHVLPRDKLREAYWLNSFVIVVVRDPFERFLSTYYGNIVRPGDNGLTKRYGRAVKELSPRGFLDLLQTNPTYGRAQINWTDYPSPAKPRADLVLRFEDVARWKEILIEHGLDVSNRELAHSNKSDRGTSDHLQKLRISQAEFDSLKDHVRKVYAEDYSAFGYV